VEQEILSPVQDPFLVTWDFFFPDMTPLRSSIAVTEYLLICFEIECNTPFPLLLKGVEMAVEPGNLQLSSTAIRFDDENVSDEVVHFEI
jgi:hypothetical protein